MAIFTYEAQELFQWLIMQEDIVVVDVRNEKDFKNFHVEAPYPFPLHNISYYEFMEDEEGSVGRIPKGSQVRIVCAKEGSAKYVAEIFDKFGYDVGYLTGGIKTWGNLLVPKLLTKGSDYELYQFIRPGKASCSYGLISGKEMMLFDPSRNIDFYLNFAKEKGCILFTATMVISAVRKIRTPRFKTLKFIASARAVLMYGCSLLPAIPLAPPLLSWMKNTSSPVI